MDVQKVRQTNAFVDDKMDELLQDKKLRDEKCGTKSGVRKSAYEKKADQNFWTKKEPTDTACESCS